ncbi:hypothetical protein [Paraclostridium sordellii]|uniref:Uncharacterized protein n=1 Tax=Paraclostridium sordellii TaxID=1505 RepID=A0A0C7G5R0_PARSO|nr:hypothetical protein [Paeniclostridium sordellii]CEN78628.1 Uncharacterised protein [[Clostridium] sordellii] [Paeniclostridium sordellii]CEQ03724.1 Uncharacterised protein [[Clostridium] sordellii] [Paeniclostridium sordellii]
MEKALNMLPIYKIITKSDRVVITPTCVKDYKPSSGTLYNSELYKNFRCYEKGWIRQSFRRIKFKRCRY